MISANGGLPAHRYTPQVTQRWPRESKLASSGFVLRCRLLCCAVSLGAVLRRVSARCSARRCAVLCRLVLLRSFGAVACCDVPSGAVCHSGVPCLPALCFVVFPCAVCSVLYLFCRGVLMRAVVCHCDVCCVWVLCLS